MKLNGRLLKVCGCTHPQLKFGTEDDSCYWVECESCGKRGPKKHSKPLAAARWLSVGPVFRGTNEPVQYTGTARRDDERFRSKEFAAA